VVLDGARAGPHYGMPESRINPARNVFLGKQVRRRNEYVQKTISRVGEKDERGSAIGVVGVSTSTTKQKPRIRPEYIDEPLLLVSLKTRKALKRGKNPDALRPGQSKSSRKSSIYRLISKRGLLDFPGYPRASSNRSSPRSHPQRGAEDEGQSPPLRPRLEPTPQRGTLIWQKGVTLGKSRAHSAIC